MTAIPQSNETPECPDCEGPMVKRVNSQTDVKFWSCADFPRCKGSRSIEDEEDPDTERKWKRRYE